MWRITPRCEPAEAEKAVTLSEIVDILESEHKAGRARAYLAGGNRFIDDDDSDRDEKNQLYVADISRDAAKKTITILVNRGDPNAVWTAYLEPSENTVRIEPPKENEAPGYSAHIVFSTVMHKEQGHVRHRACFEQMPRVSSSLVLSLINRVVSAAVKGNHKYTYTVPVKTKQKIGSRAKPYRPVLAVKRVPSERLIDDLQKGELSGVTLTKKVLFYNGVGRDQLVKNQEERITIHTAPAAPKMVAAFVRGVEALAKEKSFETITFHLDKLPHGQSNNPTLTLIEDEEALEQLYVRAQIISDFGDLFLEACYPSICKEIEEKMVAVLHSGHGW